MPKNAGRLWELEEARKRILPQSLQKERSPDTVICAP